jgi:asparagine synthase (glutamine-hydrolysing)
VPDATTLLNTMEKAVGRLVQPHRAVGVAYSGGLDSSIIAALAQKHAKVVCYSACVKGSHDADNVRAFAREDGFDVEVLQLADGDLVGLARLAKSMLHSSDPVRISYMIPSLGAIEGALEPAVLVGNVADEIFGGYAKYESGGNVIEQMAIDLEKALQEIGLLRRFAKKRDKTLLAPYADDAVIETASHVALEDKLGPEGRKLILRQCAVKIGLGASERPKKAAQYSSGVSRAVARLAKERGMTVAQWALGL